MYIYMQWTFDMTVIALQIYSKYTPHNPSGSLSVERRDAYPSEDYTITTSSVNDLSPVAPFTNMV